MIRSLILRWSIRHILNAVVIDDLLRIEHGTIFIGKVKLKPEEIAILKAEANSFEDSLLWKLMMNNLYWIANFKMMRGSNWERDMDNGRMMTLCIDTLQEFIEKLKALK